VTVTRGGRERTMGRP